ncbi:phosphonate C-P lyase system protein PhnH [Streptomyces zagrosensis]|uniref:Alpha-D-ribose 1-methylphosphonate 5-triphosphate synthase subunit PhnH n=1 Tax=Streptomyces zagrosensis TaxID=1042984 RepID=A0A7W9Q978_9ACTN|nr:phosphonate C-P lyase system protein PhnH [Streptomyces zagrosensis]MBB5935473.1 alpha-D-ribose 1-methylphosphonate 5-triphosphate synthase subunit PhnH [Streptomyces zagrosensis]
MTESPVLSAPAAPVPQAGARARALRRSPQESQRDFTVLLDVLARPGRIGALRTAAGAPVAAVAACGLADVEVALHVLAADGSEDAAWAQAVYTATGALNTTAAAARCVVALRPLTVEDVGVLHRGEPLDPETGARVFAQVDTLTDGALAGGVHGADDRDGAEGDAVLLSLTGPGIADENRLAVRGLSATTVQALSEANADYPRGIDVFLCARDGSVAGLPRTTRVRVLEGA